MPIIRQALATCLLAAAAGGLCPQSAAAQTWAPRVGAGVVVNAPNQFRGVSAHLLSSRWGGLGLYVDHKFDAQSPRDEASFDPNLTVGEVEDEIGDQFFRQQASWSTVNAAVLRPVTGELMLYAGAGYSRRRLFRQYIDPDAQRGVGGLYWVEDPDQDRATVNVLGGGLFRIGRNLSLQFGLESAPFGATVGASYSLVFGDR